MYSLVSAGVLALDLAGHPTGAAVADTVDRVLCLTPGDVAALAGAAGAGPSVASTRRHLRERCATSLRTVDAVRAVGAGVTAGLPGSAPSQALLEALTGSTLGSLDDLHAMLLRERPLADHALQAAGVQAALDAVTVAWAGRREDVELSDLAALRAPWAAALDPVPVALPDAGYGGAAPALRVLLDEVARADADRWGRVERAHWSRPGELRWSHAMHEACHAAWTSGRLVDVARAQLAAARALRLSGVSATSASHGAGMAVIAAVQATAVADLLAPSCADVLLHAWRAGSPGPQGPARPGGTATGG